MHDLTVVLLGGAYISTCRRFSVDKNWESSRLGTLGRGTGKRGKECDAEDEVGGCMVLAAAFK